MRTVGNRLEIAQLPSQTAARGRPLHRGMRGFGAGEGVGAAEGVGAPTTAALLPSQGPGPPEPPVLVEVPPGAEGVCGWRGSGGDVVAV